jgi:hypothetical protein
MAMPLPEPRPIDDLHPYQSLYGRPLDELAAAAGNPALSPGVEQAARAEILRLQTKAQIEAATATIKTADHNRRMVFWMVMAVVVTAVAATVNAIVTLLH